MPCVAALHAAEPQAPILIGVIAERSGAGAAYSIDLVRGAEMAVRDVNAAGGIAGRPLALMVVDGATQPARSAVMMRRLIGANVVAVVGGWGSDQVLANLEVTEQAGTPYVVVGATHPRITAAHNRWTFRVIQSDAVQASHLAQVVSGKLGARRVAVISAVNAYGTGSRDVFLAALQSARVQAVASESYDNGALDFSAALTRIRAAQPEVLAIFGTLPAAAAIMIQARQLGIRARFVGTGGLANEAMVVSAAAASEGTLMTGLFHEDADAEARVWADRYRREFAGGESPARPSLAAWEYRAIHGIVAPCLRRVGTDRGPLRDCLAKWRGSLFGAVADAHFDGNGQLVQPALMLEVRDGRFQLWKGGR